MVEIAGAQHQWHFCMPVETDLFDHQLQPAGRRQPRRRTEQNGHCRALRHEVGREVGRDGEVAKPVMVEIAPCQGRRAVRVAGICHGHECVRTEEPGDRWRQSRCRSHEHGDRSHRRRARLLARNADGQVGESIVVEVSRRQCGAELIAGLRFHVRRPWEGDEREGRQLSYELRPRNACDRGGSQSIGGRSIDDLHGAGIGDGRQHAEEATVRRVFPRNANGEVGDTIAVEVALRDATATAPAATPFNPVRPAVGVRHVLARVGSMPLAFFPIFASTFSPTLIGSGGSPA